MSSLLHNSVFDCTLRTLLILVDWPLSILTQELILTLTNMSEQFTKLSIIIPAYNEGRTIHMILDRVSEVILINSIQKEFILVNDCSTDDTETVLLQYIKDHPQLNMQYFKHEVNKGKGAAIHTGIAK